MTRATAQAFPNIVFALIFLLLITSCATLTPISSPTATATTTLTSAPSTTPSPNLLPIAILATPVLGPSIPHLAAGHAFDITFIHMVNANQGWGIGGLVQAADHVFRTQNGGKTWRDVTPPQPAPTEGDTIAALGFFTDASTGWVAYGGPLGSGSVPPYLLVWYTDDGGASWTYGVINTTSVNRISFSPWYLDFVDSQHGWLLVFLGGGMMHAYVALYSTSDGGATWTDILDPNTEIDIDIQSFAKTGMLFVDAQTGWLTRDSQGVEDIPDTFLTRDGGVVWSRIALPAPSGMTGWFDNNSCGMYSPVAFSTQSVLFTMKCLDNATYKVEHDYLYSTSDSGQTWQSAPLPPDFKVSNPPSGGLYFTNAQTGLALGRVIYRTDNGGRSWSLAKLVNWDGQFTFLDLNTGWAVASNAGQIALVQTVDGGRTWQKVRPVVAP